MAFNKALEEEEEASEREEEEGDDEEDEAEMELDEELERELQDDGDAEEEDEEEEDDDDESEVEVEYVEADSDLEAELNDDEDEIATTNLKVTVACPLGKMRMTIPCRPSTCDHLQCFDASLFLQMNERKPTWQCPVCDSPALYENLMVDGYFLDVIKAPELPVEENEIILNQVGTFYH